MSERKYTDEEIEKALECCAINRSCDGCPANYREHDDLCVRYIKRLALDLINRKKAEIAVLTTAVDNSTKEFLKLHDEYQDQKEEIERLREDVLEVTAILGEIELRNAQIKAEAIKEFAERVINLIYSADDINSITEWQIDNLVAEMTEGEKI